MFLLAALIIPLIPPGCAKEPQPIAETLTGQTMGTQYVIHLAQLSPGMSASRIQTGVDDLLEQVNDQMSTYRPESEISQFNASRSTEWFPVSAATARVVAKAQEISAESRGALDVTVMPLVNLWSFGPEARPDVVPTPEELAERLQKVGYQKLSVRLEPPGLKKTQAELEVDLSAIAKGYGVDAVGEYLQSMGVANFMVEIGGEVLTRGHKGDGTAWRIGIEQPISTQRAVRKILALETAALATSGDYRNFFESGEKRYSHTIDPRTGQPIDHALAVVSVIGDSCMEADGMATAVMVLGPTEGYDWLLERDVAAVMYVKTASGFEERATPAFEARLSTKSPADMP